MLATSHLHSASLNDMERGRGRLVIDMRGLPNERMALGQEVGCCEYCLISKISWNFRKVGVEKIDAYSIETSSGEVKLNASDFSALWAA